MGFKETVEATPKLTGKWKAGLGALRKQDKDSVKPEDSSTNRLLGSVDIDTAWVQHDPQGNRWDFAIGYKHDNRKDEFIYWLEVHTGSDGEITTVLRKLEWLKKWLRGEGKELAKFDRLFIWAASGATSFTKGSQQVKALASKGLIYTGSVFKIPIDHSEAKA
jgi:hypothetical protein